ncbi:MAG: histidine kinase [Proteobacteria bacterium ST_bin11]|jgi:HD-like signal output (HDOD) protein|nr:MAG: histidine kinase [Proteobacteria bacterium ST_bin11]
MMESNLINWTLDNIGSQQRNGLTPPRDMRETIAQIKALPPLPGSALRILNLIADPSADARKLADIIELDPLLTAQITRWASSALYGYRGQITTVHDAITRVLGFDFVLDLALGLAVLAPLKSPKEGQIGTRMFWTHALASTRLMAQLAAAMPATARPEPQALFLSGLMHNIGFPLLGHRFPDEFSYLSGLIVANPSLAIFNLENFAFGLNHAEVGAWLMNVWSMPRMITDIVYHHHNPYYRGENHQLNLLTFYCDCLLGRLGIGDAANQICPEEVPELLGLDQTVCLDILDSQNDDLAKIQATAEQLTD